MPTPSTISPAYQRRAREAHERASVYFPSVRAMSEGLGSSYEHLSQFWATRVPGPALTDKLERMLELCRLLKNYQPERTQIGWWLACVHFRLLDQHGRPTCPGRLAMAQPETVPTVLCAAYDDFHCGSADHRAAFARAGSPLPPQADPDPRQRARQLPWFVMQPASSLSVGERKCRPGSAGLAEVQEPAASLRPYAGLVPGAPPAEASSLETLLADLL